MTAEATPPAAGRRTVLIVLAVAWVALAGALFGYRGVYRGVTGISHDLRIVYAAGRAWRTGDNAYDNQALRVALTDAGVAGTDALWHEAPVSIYPPSTFALVAPLTLLDWPAAKPAWVALCAVMWVAVTVLAARLAGLRWRQPAGLALIGLLLAIGPPHTHLSVGQFAIPATLMLVGGYALDPARRPLLAGLLFGLALAIKPQLAVLFVILELFVGRWRGALTAIVLAGLINAAGALRLAMGGYDWLADLRRNVDLFTHSAYADPTVDGGALWFQMIDLTPLLRLATDSASLVGLVSRGGVVLLGLAMLAIYRVRRTPLAYWVAAAAAAVGTLLVTYHRSYDAVVLVIAAIAGVQLIASGRRVLGGGALAAVAAFASPGGPLVVTAFGIDAVRASPALQLLALHLTVVGVLLAGWMIVAGVAVARGGEQGKVSDGSTRSLNRG